MSILGLIAALNSFWTDILGEINSPNEFFEWFDNEVLDELVVADGIGSSARLSRGSWGGLVSIWDKDITELFFWKWWERELVEVEDCNEGLEGGGKGETIPANLSNSIKSKG